MNTLIDKIRLALQWFQYLEGGEMIEVITGHERYTRSCLRFSTADEWELSMISGILNKVAGATGSKRRFYGFEGAILLFAST